MGPSSMFPLPNDYFQPPKLSTDQIQHYISLGEELLVNSVDAWSAPSASHALESYNPILVLPTDGEQYSHHVHWKHLHDKEGLSIYRGDSLNHYKSSNDSHIPDIRAIGKVMATLDEVMDMLICDTTSEFRQMSKCFQPKTFIDGQVIHTIIPRSESHPNRYMSIKWAAHGLTSTSSGIRDYVYLEYMDVARNNAGKLVGFRIAQSIDLLDVVPSLQETHNILRGQLIREAHIFTSDGTAGSLRLSHTVRLNPRGNFSSARIIKIMESYAMNLKQMEEYVEMERISALRILDASEVHRRQTLHSESSTNGTCDLCRVFLKKQSMKFWKKNDLVSCITCAKNVCKSCVQHRSVRLPVVGFKKVGICQACILASRVMPESRDREELTADAIKVDALDTSKDEQTLLMASQLSLTSQRLLSKGMCEYEITFQSPVSNVCQKVIATGSWCDWRTDVDFGAIELLKTKDDDNAWTGTLQVAPGTYYYKFFVDGHYWTHECGLNSSNQIVKGLVDPKCHGQNLVANVVNKI